MRNISVVILRLIGSFLPFSRFSFIIVSFNAIWGCIFYQLAIWDRCNVVIMIIHRLNKALKNLHFLGLLELELPLLRSLVQDVCTVCFIVKKMRIILSTLKSDVKTGLNLKCNLKFVTFSANHLGWRKCHTGSVAFSQKTCFEHVWK